MKDVMMQEDKPEGRSFVRIRAGTIEALGDLQKVWDLDVFRHSARELEKGIFEVQGLLNEAEIKKIRLKGYEVEVISDADEVARRRLAEIYEKGGD